jgi:uncharacterized protein (DUF934 family)
MQRELRDIASSRRFGGSEGVRLDPDCELAALSQLARHHAMVEVNPPELSVIALVFPRFNGHAV